MCSPGIRSAPASVYLGLEVPVLCIEFHITDESPEVVVSNLAVPAEKPVTFRSVSFLFALVAYQQIGLNIFI